MGCIQGKSAKNNRDNPFVFIPKIYSSYVIKVYDGDTITISANLSRCSNTYYKFSVRFRGIDTPEMKSHSEDEKTAAHIAKIALSDKILHKYVYLKDIKYDKYGRLLADVYYKGTCMNQWMLDNRYGVAYDGGTKHIPSSWLDYQKKKPDSRI